MIWICSNNETLAQHVDPDFDWAIKDFAVESIDYGDMLAITGDTPFECSNVFREWHGGRFDQFFKRVGALVAYQYESERQAAEVIADKIQALLDQRAAEIKRQWDEVDSEREATI